MNSLPKPGSKKSEEHMISIFRVENQPNKKAVCYQVAMRNELSVRIPVT
jgi:hypothetical protein